MDDLLIYVRVEAIDGADGAVAQTTICARRSEDDGGLPFIGSMTFDEADLASLETDGFLQPMVVHQMAHVLGFGLRRAALDAVHVHDDLRRAPINGGRSAQPTHSV